MSPFWLLLICVGVASSIRITKREQQLDSNQTEENPIRSLASSLAPIPGNFYMVRSKYGRYLDMRQESGDIHNVLSLSETYMNNNQWARDSFLVELIDNGDGYYMVKSKYGRYLDMRQESSGEALNVWSISESRMKNNLWAKDSFLVKLIDDGDSYFWIKSKFGHYLDMRQGEGNYFDALALKENYMNKNLWARDSFVVQFVPV